jgi:hypothetical protein
MREAAPTAVVPRSDAQTEVVARRDRAVRREDARQLTFEAPADETDGDDPAPEPPLRPGEIPRARDED